LIAPTNNNCEKSPYSGGSSRATLRGIASWSAVWLVALVPHSYAVAEGEAIRSASEQVKEQRHRTALRSTGPQTTAALGDCNANGIDDADEIEDCAGASACDDCNLNGLPDECDITSGISNDLDLDGVPDECVLYDDMGADSNWSTPENWDDDEVPNNLDLEGDESVTVDASNVYLDMVVEVDTLRLLDGSTLNVIGSSTEDLEIEEAGGILIASKGMAQSRLFLGDSRRISALAGTLHIKSGGVYSAAAVGSASGLIAEGTSPSGPALLEVANVLIESRCGEPIAGAMLLSGDMVTDVLGNLTVDASKDCVVCAFCTGSVAGHGSVAGGETPPILSIRDAAVLRIAGDFAVLGPGQVVHTSTTAIEVGGNFVNRSSCPECLQLSGSIVFTNPVEGAGAGVPSREFEVAGQDVGPDAAGLRSNFAVGTLEVSQDAALAFVDNFSNTGTGDPEALYVGALVLRRGATVVLRGTRVYYNTLIDEGAVIDAPAGSLVRIAGAEAIPAASSWGLVAMILTLLSAGSILVRRVPSCR